MPQNYRATVSCAGFLKRGDGGEVFCVLTEAC